MKPQFNKEGFLAFQQALYLTNDEALKTESEQIQCDFMAWINLHFELSLAQFKQLQAISPQAIRLLSFDTSFAVENRLPIDLNQTIEVNHLDWKTVGLPKNESIIHGNANYSDGGRLQIDLSYKD